MLCFFHMETMIRIPKTEYRALTKIAKNYDLLRRVFTLNFFEKPAVRSRKQIMKELKATGSYNAAFLKSLQKGLDESSYFTS